jgi:hypothetical protein
MKEMKNACRILASWIYITETDIMATLKLLWETNKYLVDSNPQNK